MMVPVGLDFESHYDRATFSLSRMTVEEYVRDPRFQAIGLSIKIGFDAPAIWYARPDIEKGLATVPWEKALMIAHNCPWDGAALGWIYGRYPKAYACTLAMSRALGTNFYGGASLKAQVILANQFSADLPPKTDEVEEFDGYRYEDFNPEQLARYGAYCNNDTTSTMGLFKWYVQSLNFPKMELAAMDEVIQMFVRPRLHLDKDLLIARLAAVRHRRDVLLTRMGVTVTQVRSDAAFALLLEGLGVDPPTKLSPKQKNSDGSPKEVFAFAKSDDGMKELEGHEDILVQTLVACRLKSKSTIEEARMERLIGIAGRGALPVPYKYYGAHTGRVAAEGKINMANMPRPQSPRRLDEGMLVKMKDGFKAIHQLSRTGQGFTLVDDDKVYQSIKNQLAGIRDTIIAPPGYVLVASDSSQIEARILAWFAQQQDLIDLFFHFIANPAGDEDTYTTLASDIYGRRITKSDKIERFVGKEARLGLGYQMGWRKFQRSVKVKTNPPLLLDDEFCEGVVEVYRRKNLGIAGEYGVWKNNQRALAAMIAGETFDIGRPGVCIAMPADKKDPMPRIKLPNGMFLRYPGLEMERVVTDKGYTSKKYSYHQVKGKSHLRSNIYGGKNTENECIAGDTLVATDVGWVPLHYINRAHRIWDGEEFVRHGGVIDKGVQSCVSIDGVYMTTDHEVLTHEGWTPALEKPQPYWVSFWPPNWSASNDKQRQKDVLDVLVSLRPARGEGGHGRDQGDQARVHAPLWVYSTPYATYSWYEQAPSVRSVQVNGRSVPTTHTPVVGQLRRAWDHGVQALGNLRELLGRHGTNIQTRLGLGSSRQRARVLSEELPLGGSPHQLHEQAQHRAQGGCIGAGTADGHWSVHDLLPTPERMEGGRPDEETRLQKQVYDILDCGPRHRFVVKGKGAPFVVHNCQALARIVITDQWLKAKKTMLKEGMFKHSPFVIHSYDEIVACVPESAAEETLEIVTKAMSISPDFMPGIPVACEAGYSQRYGDAK